MDTEIQTTLLFELPILEDHEFDDTFIAFQRKDFLLYIYKGPTSIMK